MSVDLKYLIEQKNEKLETMKKIIESAKEEKRSMSEEDIKVFNQLKTEVTNVENTIRSVEGIRNIELNDAQLEKNAKAKRLKTMDLTLSPYHIEIKFLFGNIQNFILFYTRWSFNIHYFIFFLT